MNCFFVFAILLAALIASTGFSLEFQKVISNSHPSSLKLYHMIADQQIIPVSHSYEHYNDVTAENNAFSSYNTHYQDGGSASGSGGGCAAAADATDPSAILTQFAQDRFANR